jgi:hypothetical protein
MNIDFAPIVDQVVLPILAPIVIAAAGLAAKRIADFAHVQLSAADLATFDGVVARGVALAQSDIDGSPILVSGPAMVANVVGYANETAPALVKRLGVSPAALGQAVAARIAAANPTPPPGAQP